MNIVKIINRLFSSFAMRNCCCDFHYNQSDDHTSMIIMVYCSSVTPSSQPCYINIYSILLVYTSCQELPDQCVRPVDVTRELSALQEPRLSRKYTCRQELSILVQKAQLLWCALDNFTSRPGMAAQVTATSSLASTTNGVCSEMDQSLHLGITAIELRFDPRKAEL